MIVPFNLFSCFIYFVKCSDYPLIECPPSSSTVFNLCFQGPNKTIIKTTYGSKGYYVDLKVGSNIYNIRTTSKTYDNIQFNTNLVNVHNQGIGVWHTINNIGTSSKIVSFAVHSDAQISSNDAVPISKLPNMSGLRLTYRDYNLDIRFPKIEGYPTVSSIWIGYYSSRKENKWLNSTIYSYSSDDSGFAYSVQNITIKPNQQIQFGTATSSDTDVNVNEILNVRPSLMFTPSNRFTPSNKFTQSYEFTFTEKFSQSNSFSISSQFSFSDLFSKSDSFSLSNFFSYSNVFTKSSIFSDSFSFVPTPTKSVFGEVIHQSMTVSLTNTRVKTVTVSALNISSIFTVCNSNLECKTVYYTKSLIHYIIYTYKPINTSFQVFFASRIKKKSISGEQLIGIVSGSTATFFLFLGIGIIIKNRPSPFEGISDIDSSSQNNSDSETSVEQYDITVPLGRTENADDIDMWV